MAIVNLSPRILSNTPLEFTGSSTEKIDLSFRENRMSIGSLNKKNLIKPSIAPFNTLSIRPFPGNKNNVPGPGSYQNKSTISKPKLYYLDEPYSLSREPRFKKSSANNKPGPGAYFIQNKFKKKKERNWSAIKFHPDYETNLDQRVRSIPSKDNQHGDFINDKGEITILEDPNKQHMHEGNKTSSVSTDQYCTLLKKDNKPIVWKRNSTELTRVKFQKKTTIVKDKNEREYHNENKTINNTTISIKQKAFFDYIKRHRQEILDLNNDKKHSSVIIRDKCHPSFLTRVERDQQLPQQQIYEYTNGSIINTSQIKSERYQFFGSSSDRYLLNAKESDTINTPGPGSYFQLSNSKINRIIPIQKDIRLRNMSYIPLIDYDVGPGSYDIFLSSPKEMLYDKIHFSSSQKRFPEVNNLEIGPGAYDITSHLDKKRKEYKNRPLLSYHRDYNKLNNCLSQGFINIPPDNEQKEFNSKYNDSIYFRLKDQVKNIKSHLAPFASKSERFANPSMRNVDNDLGPTSYSKDYFNISYIPKVNKVPFLSSQRKKSIIDSSNIERKCGPGEYLYDSYFNHVKKSYNLRYI